MKLKLLVASLVAGATLPASAQTQVSFANYTCNNGVKFPVAFGPGYVSVQIDGKSVELPHRALSVFGTRYAKDGIVFVVKGINAQLTHSGVTSACIQDY